MTPYKMLRKMLNFRESKAKVLELKSPMYDIYSPTCFKFIFMVNVGEYNYNTWILWAMIHLHERLFRNI